jgi:CBS domain-containing protein
MKIREVMTPAPVTVNSDEPVTTVAQLMKEYGIGAVPVLTDRKVTGILTDRDIAVRVLAAGRDPADTLARDAASTDPATLDVDDDAGEAVRGMRERAVRRLPVTDGGEPVGMVSIGDLALTQDEQSALADVSAAPPNL